jgi:hypothetical protein
MKDDEYLIKQNKLILPVLIIAAFLLVVFSFFSPYILTLSSFVKDFSDTGQIGDTVGGIVTPFITLAGVFITFLAFYMQYKANQIQIDNFRKELTYQQLQFQKQQFENQFYEMLKLHKENVNEIIITPNLSSKSDIKPISGRAAFQFFIDQITLFYLVRVNDIGSSFEKSDFIEAYTDFYHGINNMDYSEEYISFKKRLESYENNNNKKNPTAIKQQYANLYNYDIYSGNSHFVSTYLRHLFMTIKFVTNQHENFLNYNEKRQYLLILRTQLSYFEQIFLFYHWLSDYGLNWENHENHFFTDYRMIHNILPYKLIQGIKLDNYFENLKDILTDDSLEKDSLFEYLDYISTDRKANGNNIS